MDTRYLTLASSAWRLSLSNAQSLVQGQPAPLHVFSRCQQFSLRPANVALVPINTSFKLLSQVDWR